MVKCDHLLSIPEAVSAGPVPKFLPSFLCPNKKARAIGHSHDLTASRKHFLSVFPEKERKYASQQNEVEGKGSFLTLRCSVEKMFTRG